MYQDIIVMRGSLDFLAKQPLPSIFSDEIGDAIVELEPQVEQSLLSTFSCIWDAWPVVSFKTKSTILDVDPDHTINDVVRSWRTGSGTVTFSPLPIASFQFDL